MKKYSICIPFLLAGCIPYPVKMIVKPDIPEDFLIPVSTTPKQIALTKNNIESVETSLSQDNKTFFRFLLYNYYDNYYGLQICNLNLVTIDSYIKDYDKQILKL